MPKSPKRKKKQPYQKVKELAYTVESLFQIGQGEKFKFLVIRRLLCLLLRCNIVFVKQGYPRYNRYFHVHTQCNRCGAERIFIDLDEPVRSMKTPLRCEVLTFERISKHESPSILPLLTRNNND